MSVHDVEQLVVYIGTYTSGEGGGQGIHLCRLDMRSGALNIPTLATESVNPSFLAVHPSGWYLYAVNEIDTYSGERGGTVSSFAVDPGSNQLKLLNRQPTQGTAPCHVSIDRTGQRAMVANYGGGTVTVFPVRPSGELGAASYWVQHTGSGHDPRRQDAPHPHSMQTDSSNGFVFVPDLGLDRIVTYAFDADNGTLDPGPSPDTALPAGAGPRHFAFHPNGRFGYVINELNSTVTAFRYDEGRGALTEIQTVSTLPEGFNGTNYPADLHLHPSGRFLYGSNRGHDSIVIYRVDASTGRLTCLGHESTQGRTPRNFSLDPTGTYLLVANQDSGTVLSFRIEAETGRPLPTSYVIEVPAPVCVKVIPKRKSRTPM